MHRQKFVLAWFYRYFRSEDPTLTRFDKLRLHRDSASGPTRPVFLSNR